MELWKNFQWSELAFESTENFLKVWTNLLKLEKYSQGLELAVGDWSLTTDKD